MGHKEEEKAEGKDWGRWELTSKNQAYEAQKRIHHERSPQIVHIYI